MPALLDEVHWLIENRGLHFALCGSSARKVRRGAANLLGGRAGRYELRGLTAGELGTAFDLNRMLNHGYLPRIYQAARPRRLLDAYVADYLREEVAAGGLVRNPPAFSGSLDDTLLGRWLNAYRRRRKRRVIGAPKFYFADVGVVNRLSRRGELSAGSQLYGKAFENWVFHELSACIEYQEWDLELTYWRLPSGIEVNFVLGDMGVVVEAKASARITRDHLRRLRTLVEEHPRRPPAHRRLS